MARSRRRNQESGAAGLETRWTPEHREWTRRAVDAEARGDAKAALEAYDHTPHAADAWAAQLTYLARAGDDAPEWLVARWVRAQAVRWMLLNEDPRIESAVLEVLPTHDLPEAFTGEWLREYGSLVAANDRLCHGLALHPDGGFEDFLDLRAGDELLGRAGRVREWPNQPLGVYEYLDVQRDVLTVRDLMTGRGRKVLHLGAMAGVGRGARVLGRLVPVETAPGLMFEHRPIEIDAYTARRLVEALDVDGYVLDHLYEAAKEGRIPWRPGTRVVTQLWSDALLVDRCEERAGPNAGWAGSGSAPAELPDTAGIVRVWIEAGMPEEVAWALATCRLALAVADTMPAGLPVAATQAAIGLAAPAVLDAAWEHLTAPEHAAAWRAFAECVQEPLRSQCRALAAHAARDSPATGVPTPR